ncbi:MAG TPA: hypothetical protein VFN85_06185 [Solirubrobacterales bacterium]|nr:hypothetical protein [Solirubrobacterales bacterium]
MSRGRIGARGALLLSVSALIWAGGATPAGAATPVVSATWATSVTASSAVLHAEVNPEGLKTQYHFDYIDAAAYQANLEAGRDGFAGAARVPVATEGNIPASLSVEEVLQHVGGLLAETVYHYRIVTANSSGSAVGPPREFFTQTAISTFVLPDDRGWEMVSPAEKNGGEVQGVGGTAAGGVLQAAAQGGAITYSSTSSFAEAQGAFGASQYIARRQGSGWLTENITLPMVSGGYGLSGVPYQLFSPGLERGLVINGRRCRVTGEDCPVPNPPVAGTDAPAGYLDYYLRDDATGGFEALLGESELSNQPVSAENFEVAFVGAAPDLGHVVLSTCAALTADAIAVPTGEDSCDAGSPNLYEWSGAGLRLINVLPGDSTGTPGAKLAAQGAAVSSDGNRVYWIDLATGALFLREVGAGTILVDPAGTFETASADGSIAFFSKSGHLYRFNAETEASQDLTPAGGLEGVLGASEDGSYVYYLTSSGLHLWHNGSTALIASGADPSSYPPATGTARVSSDGRQLVFMSSSSLTSYENLGDMEVYLYDAGAGKITCVSCNPTGQRPEGAASIPGAAANGEGPQATDVYKPRVLSSDGSRIFFDSSDALIPQDTNHEVDVYEWEAQGVGGCGRNNGCIGPISSGRGADGATFVDASVDGSDAFFLTDASLVSQDGGGLDVYDARVGGGFPEPVPPLACVGDNCQVLPPPPEDPTPGTGFFTDEGNPPLSFPKTHKKKHRKRHHGKHHGKRRHGGRNGKGGHR